MNLYDVLKKPLVSEKAEMLRSQNCYVFEVDKRANKILVKQAIRQLYGVTPEKVNVINNRGKYSRNRYGMGKKSDRKKAYVFLGKNDKITIFEGV